MTSDTQKKARNKWDSNNMTVLGCKLRKDEAEAFKEACQREGTTPNAIFRQAIAEFMKRQQAGTAEPPTEAEAQAGVVMVSPGGVPDENICSHFISQWGPDFQSALDASGQSAEDYIKQAVAERVKRETRPPTPEWIKRLFPDKQYPVIYVEHELKQYERNRITRHFTQEQKAEWYKEFRLEIDEKTAEDKKNGTGIFATRPTCNLDIYT